MGDYSGMYAWKSRKCIRILSSASSDDSAENAEEIYEYDDPAYANGIALKTTFKAVTSLTATVKPAKDAVIMRNILVFLYQDFE